MSKTDNSCKYHLVILNAVVFIGNVAMAIYIIINRKKQFRGSLLYGCLCASNTFSSLYMFLPAAISNRQAVKDESDHPLSILTVSFRCIIVCFNCGFNLAMAYSKICAVTQPFKYSNAVAVRRLNRRLVLTVFISTLGFATLNAFVTATTKIQSLNNWAITITLVITYIALCITYFKLVRAYQRGNNNLAAASPGGNNMHVIEERKRKERYLTCLFIGTTTSFFIFNLPVMVLLPMISPSAKATCSSTNTKLALFAATFSLIDILLDPLWFFMTLWWKSRKSASQAAPQHELAVLPGNANNEIAVVGKN